jgi:hypothetical protein
LGGGFPPPDALPEERIMRYVASPDCVACDVDGGTAILDLKSNTYFSLDPVGADVWQALVKPASLDDLTQVIAADYDVAAPQCRQDIAALLEDLSHHGLIQAA